MIQEDVYGAAIEETLPMADPILPPWLAFRSVFAFVRPDLTDKPIFLRITLQEIARNERFPHHSPTIKMERTFQVVQAWNRKQRWLDTKSKMKPLAACMLETGDKNYQMTIDHRAIYLPIIVDGSCHSRQNSEVSSVSLQTSESQKLCAKA
jgi:hypothetical protein